ncbi:uncharacterized protein LOC120667912 [Panicum virgatum]|uniref:uncharacterized protein LOC120667912 n=1 Tax=Panicum virgatum TaxID=38727 RepID=UPI0019D52745|nr:uncharacterized protein LOC120667912 [Panicum virgatum]
MLLLPFHFLTRKSRYKLIFSLNHFCRSWTVLSGGAHKRKVNDILGLLCREHFPGLVHYQGRYEPAWTWDHYIAANNDQLDRSGRAFENKAERVKGELWDFYRCDEGYEERAAIVAHNQCVKLVKDMHYEAQVQCVINYCAHFLKQKIRKSEARDLKLTREQYLQVPAWWCRNDTVCWERIVDKWFDPEWQALHDAGRQRRLLMPGPAHHQGSLNNDEYRARWSSSHEGQECPPFLGWALARKGKATSNVTYNLDDPPSAYNNSSIHNRIQAYTEMGRQVGNMGATTLATAF